MAEIIKLTCPACGAKLEVTEDIERFACSYCGNEHIVIRRGGIVTLRPVVEGLERVRIGTDKTASELALARLGKEIAQLEGQLSALPSEFFSELPSFQTGCAVLLLVMGIGSILIMFDNENPLTAAFCGIVFLGLGIVLLWGDQNLRRARKAKRTEIEQQLEAKRQEYRRHQEIVEEI